MSENLQPSQGFCIGTQGNALRGFNLAARSTCDLVSVLEVHETNQYVKHTKGQHVSIADMGMGQN